MTKTNLILKQGFSLFEMIIILVIISILFSFSYPNYQAYMTRARRSDGHVALLNLAQRMEQYYSQHATYANATIANTSTTDVTSTALSPQGWYVLSIITATATAYVLQATPVGTQAMHDRRCQSLILESTGINRIAPGPAGNPTGSLAECQ